MNSSQFMNNILKNRLRTKIILMKKKLCDFGNIYFF